MPFSQVNLSRRAFLPLAAAAVLSPSIVLSAQAQATAWQIYRPEGLGFEAEMPGEPKITVENGEPGDITVRTVDAVVDVDEISFGANFQEYRQVITMRKELVGQQLFARGLEGRIARDVAFTMNGFDGREYAVESTGLNAIIRVVILKNRRIALTVLGQAVIHDNGNVRRFLESLKLLP